MQIDPETQKRFLEIAIKSGMLDRSAAEQAEIDAAGQSIGINQFVLQNGILSAVEVDIADTLSRPLESVPGYEILDLLGQGGMGVVYRARQQNLDRIVALKTVLVSQLSDKKATARFEKEAIMVARLQHPNIVSAFDFGRKHGRYYFCMEYVQGTDLNRQLARIGRFDEQSAWKIVRQVALGLAHAAKQNIIHRDVKPANLLLVESDDQLGPDGFSLVKISDFGLAVLSSAADDSTRITNANSAVGSPPYMSPEQFESRELTTATDIYSLGATMCHLLSGETPFKGMAPQQMIAARLKGQSPLDEKIRQLISPYSAQLLERMLHSDAKQRCSYQEIVNKIEQLPIANEYAVTETIQLGRTNQNSSQLTTSLTGVPTTTVHERVDMSGIPDRAPGRRPGSWQRLVMIAAVLAIAVAVALMFRPSSYTPGPRSLKAGESAPLYNGRNLDGWPITPIDGSWFTEEDELGSTALAGISGAHRRQFPEPVWENFSISALVWLHDAKAVEFHFGLESTSDLERRAVVRLTRSEVQVGHRASRAGPWEPDSYMNQIPDQDTSYVSIIIEKQPTDWFVFCEEEFVGSIPVGDAKLLSELHVEAIDGKAWFHEMRITKLVESN